MLRIVSYNIHKGFSPLNRQVVLEPLRQQLQQMQADVVFLQEVQGEHARHPRRHAAYPNQAQHEFLAAGYWPHQVYGKNCVYAAGHHGNAILSHHPIAVWHNRDISAHRFESRGLLHAELHWPEAGRVHALCTHFGLFAGGRRKQVDMLVDYVRQQIPADEPLILAGDFNDWQNRLSAPLAAALGLQDVFQQQHGQVAKSFPARWPLLRLDRIYVRGFEVQHCAVHAVPLSDHALLTAQLRRA